MGDVLDELAHRAAPIVPDVTSFDPSALDAAALAAARFVWARRVANETASIEVGSRLLQTARALSLGERTLAAIARLEADERVHADLSRAMLARLGDADFTPPEVLPRLPDEPLAQSWVRQLVCAVCIGETVSASRYAAVREVTDLAVPRACIDLFLRDEALHGRLGFALLPEAMTLLTRALGEQEAHAFAERMIASTLRHFDATIGMDGERRGMPEARRQPENNPGVVEPAIDALAFYDAVSRTIVPSFEACAVAAARAWKHRWAS